MVEGSCSGRFECQAGAQTRLGWVAEDLQLSMVLDSSRIGIGIKEHKEYMVVKERVAALAWSLKAPQPSQGSESNGSLAIRSGFILPLRGMEGGTIAITRGMFVRGEPESECLRSHEVGERPAALRAVIQVSGRAIMSKQTCFCQPTLAEANREGLNLCRNLGDE